MFDVFSHLRSPKIIFEEVCRILRPRGYFMLRTGNGADLPGKANIRDWEVPKHLFFASTDTMRRYFSDNGLCIVAWEKTSWLDARATKESLSHADHSGVFTLVKKAIAHIPAVLPTVRYILQATNHPWTKFESWLVLGQK